MTTVDVTVVINYMPYNNATLRLQSFTGLTQATIPLNYSNRIITFQVPRNTTNYLYFTHPGAAPNTGSSGCYSFSIALAPSSGSLRTSDEHLSNNTFESKDMQRTITFSPNPVEGGTTLHFPELTDVTIFDLSGKMVSIFKATNQISTDNLKAGVYFIKLNGNNTEKLVVY
ncbi:MAG: T9SS type A sorting domain-containing protein [Bacteroidetes bacterium]|nr:T9SS type A sorting domain-containing protein [Bacteroidota bacterium]